MKNKTAWRTMNWIRMGGQVFMVQQKWRLYREKEKDTYNSGHAAISQEPFPTDDWRIVNLKDVLSDRELEELLEVRNNE